MKMTLALPALAGLLLTAAPVRAETKIGFVDFQRAVNEVEEGKAARSSLKRDFDEKQKSLDKDKVELERLQAEFEKQAAVLSDEAKRDKAMEIQRRMGDAQGKLVGFQKELSEREREVMRSILDKMVALTKEISEAEGYGIVFERNDAGVVVAPPASDFTNELVRKFNARYKVGGDGAAKPEKKAEKKPAKGADKAEKKDEAK